MKINKLRLLQPLFILVCASVGAKAATLTIPQDTAGNFGRAGGFWVDFTSTLASGAENRWAGTPPQNGELYSIDSLTVYRQQGTGGNAANNSTYEQLYIGVYASYSGTTGSSGVFGEFLGVSNPQTWGAVATGTAVTWTFSGISLDAAPGATLIFAFQDTAASRTGLAPMSSPEGALGIQRVNSNQTLANNGVAIIEADGGATSGSHGYVRGGDGANGRVPFITVETTLIPEPSVSLLGAIGALGLLRRRRNG